LCFINVNRQTHKNGASVQQKSASLSELDYKPTKSMLCQETSTKLTTYPLPSTPYVRGKTFLVWPVRRPSSRMARANWLWFRRRACFVLHKLDIHTPARYTQTAIYV